MDPLKSTQKCVILKLEEGGETELQREALIRELRKLAKAMDQEFEVETNKGKGSHYRVRLGSKFTTLKSGELTPNYVRLIKKQLGVE